MFKIVNLKFIGQLIFAASLLTVAGCGKRLAAPTSETAAVQRGSLTQKITATGLLSAA